MHAEARVHNHTFLHVFTLMRVCHMSINTHVGNTTWEHMLGTHVETFHLASVTETESYHMYHMSVCNPQPEEKWHTSCDVTKFTQVRDVTLV